MGHDWKIDDEAMCIKAFDVDAHPSPKPPLIYRVSAIDDPPWIDPEPDPPPCYLGLAEIPSYFFDCRHFTRLKPLDPDAEREAEQTPTEEIACGR